MPDPILIFELVLRGVAIGALIATAAGVHRGASTLGMRVASALFFASVVAYALNSTPATHNALGPFLPVVHVLSMGGSGLFWMFVVTLFEDRRLDWPLFAPALVLLGVGFVGLSVQPPLRNGIWVAHNLLEVSLAAHVLIVIRRSWRGDLVEARRRMRGPFMAFVTLFTIVLAGFEIAEEGLGVFAWWFRLAGAGALAVFAVAGAAWVLEAREGLFGASHAGEGQRAAPEASDGADRALLDRLETVMSAGEGWRREGLTIGALAEEVGAPEHRLRRLINDRLGYRNFAAFVNARRIEAARRALADPAQALRPVSAIAFDLGFGSLGPFNRAFKEETGETPTQWRRRALAEGAPIPENPR